MRKKKTFVKIVLWIAGIIAIVIGSGLLFVPVAFQASAGIELGNSPALLSEMRGPGGVILASGIVMIAGAFISEITLTALILSTLLYTSYGIARLLSLIVDGVPTSAIVAAMIAEFILGIVSLLAMATFRKHTIQQVTG